MQSEAQGVKEEERIDLLCVRKLMKGGERGKREEGQTAGEEAKV